MFHLISDSLWEKYREARAAASAYIDTISARVLDGGDSASDEEKAEMKRLRGDADERLSDYEDQRAIEKRAGSAGAYSMGMALVPGGGSHVELLGEYVQNAARGLPETTSGRLAEAWAALPQTDGETRQQRGANGELLIPIEWLSNAAGEVIQARQRLGLTDERAIRAVEATAVANVMQPVGDGGYFPFVRAMPVMGFLGVAPTLVPVGKRGIRLGPDIARRAGCGRGRVSRRSGSRPNSGCPKAVLSEASCRPARPHSGSGDDVGAGWHGSGD